MRLSIVVLSILLLSCGSAKTSAEKDTQLAEINTLVNSGNYNFSANRAVVTKMGPIDLIGNYNYLRFKNDSVFAELPFYGERYVGGNYGGDGGVIFEGIPENLTISTDDRRKKIRIDFRISKKQERYNISIQIFHNKSTTVDVNSSQRSYISYRGTVEELKKKS